MIVDLPAAAPADVAAVTWAPNTPLATPGRPDLARVRCRIGDLPDLAAALPPRGPRLRVEIDADRWPAVVDVAALVAGGLVDCVVDPLGLPTGADWVRFVAFLVAAREHGLEPRWTLPGRRPEWVRADLLNHLAPPIAGAGADARTSADVDAWSAAYRFGRLFWRRGPGFASVVDSRGEDTARYVIDDPELLALFGELAQPLEVSTMSPSRSGGLGELQEAGLVVVEEGWAVRLPYRLRHRPMPGNQV